MLFWRVVDKMGSFMKTCEGQRHEGKGLTVRKERKGRGGREAGLASTAATQTDGQTLDPVMEF